MTYLHIPCREPLRAADFYEAVLWTPRKDSDELAFVDATGLVIRQFISDEPSEKAEFIPYVKSRTSVRP